MTRERAFGGSNFIHEGLVIGVHLGTVDKFLSRVFRSSLVNTIVRLLLFIYTHCIHLHDYTPS
jgi:hypothetical protein